MTTNGTASIAWQRRIKEPIALLVWIYAFIKLFVFDIDLYILGIIAPSRSWLLNLRILVLAAILALSWLILGHRRFFLGIAYIAVYPFIILFWKLPRLIWRQWAAMLILLPSFYSTLGSLRFTFVLYTVAAISIVIIALSNSPYLLIPSMISLVYLLLIINFRAFRSAQSSSVFSRLAEIIRNLHPKIISGDYDLISPTTPQRTVSEAEDISDGSETQQLSQLYILHFAADYVAKKVMEVSKERQYNSLLAISLLAVTSMTIFIFAMLNWALFKINPQSFNGVGGYPFIQFIAYSMGKLASADLTPIQPSSPLSTIIAFSEVFFSLVILAILVFSILTAARDAYREDFHEFERSLHETASVIEDRIVVKYHLTAEELEVSIADTSRDIVNMLRKLQGMPEIEDTDDELSKLADGAGNDSHLLAP